MKATGSRADAETEWSEEKVNLDRYNEEVLMCRQQGLPVARISATVGRSIEFGERKCSFTVSIECNQSKGTMDQAAELVFNKALEYANDGMTHIAPGLPLLGADE